MDLSALLQQLIALVNRESDERSRIYKSICNGLSLKGEHTGAASHCLRSFNEALFGHPTITPSGEAFLSQPKNGLVSKNIAFTQKTLHEFTFFHGHYDICGQAEIGFRRFLYPFVLTVCMKVDAGMGSSAYLVPERSIDRIRKRARTLFKTHSFAAPVIYDRLLPVSAFSMSAALDMKVQAMTRHFADYLYHGNLRPRPLPDFSALYSAENEAYSETLGREYRMLVGVACLQCDLSESPVDLVRSLCNRSLPLQACNSMNGWMSPSGFLSDSKRRNIYLSRVTINRPYPALDGFNHFAQGILPNDQPTSDFWDVYSEL